MKHSIVDYRNFINENFNRIFTKSRKREIVMERRFLTIFLVKEAELSKHKVARILRVKHPSIHYFLKPVIDREFDIYYRRNIQKLRENFENFKNSEIREVV